MNKEKIFYALVVPVIVAVSVYVIQRYLDSAKPPLSIRSENGVLFITNNSEQALKVRARYVYELPDGSNASCFFPAMDSAVNGKWPTQLLLPGETREFPPQPLSECPGDSGAVMIDYGVRAWTSDNVTLFEIRPGKAG